MSEVIQVDLPASREDLATLSAGDEVRLSGVAFTARDATHARLVEELERDGELPYGLAGQALFYAGPTPAAAGRPAGAIGPTTASRLDAWTPELLDAGIMATIGKGARSGDVAAACAQHGAVYFTAVGGSAALLATHVTGLEPVAFEDLGPEALVRATFDDFPAFVGIDAQGRDLFEVVRREWAGRSTP